MWRCKMQLSFMVACLVSVGCQEDPLQPDSEPVFAEIPSETALTRLAADSTADIAALVAIYNSTSGPSWDRMGLTGWPPDSTPFASPWWTGVGTKDGRVGPYLDLSSRGLSGKLPDAIGDLTAVTRIFLRYNSSLKGKLPSSIRGIKGLNELYLEGTYVCIPNDLHG